MEQKNNDEYAERFMKAVFKSAIKALFEIGVKSTKYIDAYTYEFSKALDKEFVELGIYKPNDPINESQVEDRKENPPQDHTTSPPESKNND